MEMGQYRGIVGENTQQWQEGGLVFHCFNLIPKYAYVFRA